ncbi:MAG: proline dehydrogenase family protein [Vicinamibacterales bacterium]
MSLARTALLRISDSRWMREHGVKAPFVRRAVAVFMPGETAEDMLAAATTQATDGVGAVFTRLGENVRDLDEAQQVTDHYLAVVDQVQARGLACEPSVKLTQLGLDVDADRAFANALAIGRRADQAGNYFWVDMEQSPYVDRTLDVVCRLRAEVPRIGVALQAYLHRTAADVEAMLAHGIGIRLVKGAYAEPPTMAFPKKADVDAAYLTLAHRMLAPDARAGGSRAVFGTHDTAIIGAIERHGDSLGLAPTDYEIHMLYGIQRAEQRRLARERRNLRVLIAYGTYWFPWYMRRLAERPANVWFVAKSLFR